MALWNKNDKFIRKKVVESLSQWMGWDGRGANSDGVKWGRKNNKTMKNESRRIGPGRNWMIRGGTRGWSDLKLQY